MHIPWDAETAARCKSELALRAYSSRLLGSDTSLVLLGGGNTSVKLLEADGEEMLFVKGTGADLAHVQEQDFTPLKLKPVRAMLRHANLDYTAMMAGLADHIAAPDAPRPSIETLLHAALPARYVEHTHADAILAITNTRGGIPLVRKVFGDLALVVPYRHSGFALAKICAEAWGKEATVRTIGIILMHHGVVACGATAEDSYSNMLRLVGLAGDYLAEHGGASLPKAVPPTVDETDVLAIAALRSDISRAAGYPLLLTRCEDPVATAFALSAGERKSALQSPATPQHAVFARRVPMLGRNVEAYARSYAEYLQLHPDGARRLDAAPRIVFDAELGMLAAGITPWYMDAAAISYCHTIATMLRADAHDTYQGLSPKDVLAAELEYGGAEHRIAANRTADAALAGTVSLLAPSLGTSLAGIKDAILAAGSAVEAFDNRSEDFVRAIARFGGIDTLVCTPDDGPLIERTLPWLKLSPTQAHIVLVDMGSKAADESRAILERVRDAGIEIVEVEAQADTALTAHKIVEALAIPSTHSFPEFVAS